MGRTSPHEVEGLFSEEEYFIEHIRSILETLPPEKLDTLPEQAFSVDGEGATTVSIMQRLVVIIFDKAFDEPSFSGMCSELCVRMSESETFKCCLLSKCQEEFESRKVKPDRETEGLIRFIGELFKKKLLPEKIIHMCLVILLGEKNPREGDIECLCTLLAIIGEQIDHPKAKLYLDFFFGRMANMSENPTVAPRIRSMLKNIIKLRSNGWKSQEIQATENAIKQVNAEQQHQTTAQEESAMSREEVACLLEQREITAVREDDVHQNTGTSSDDGDNAPRQELAQTETHGNESGEGAVSEQQPTTTHEQSVMAREEVACLLEQQEITAVREDNVHQNTGTSSVDSDNAPRQDVTQMEARANERTLIVSLWEQDGEPFFRVSDAVAAARDGNTVRVECLDYREPDGLVIDKALVLVGVDSEDGQKVTITRSSPERSACITLAGSGGEVRNVKVVAAKGGSGIDIQSGHWILRDVEVVGEGGGVAVRSDASLSAVGCTFGGGLVTTTGEVTMERCRMDGMGARIKCEGDVRMKRCVLKVDAMAVKGLLHMEDCKVVGNMEVENVGRRTVSVLHRSQFRGEVSLCGQGKVSISGSSMRGVTCGLRVSGRELSATCLNSNIYGIAKSHEISLDSQFATRNSEMGHGYRRVSMVDEENNRGTVNCICISPVGDVVAVGRETSTGQNVVQLWELRSGRLRKTLQGHTAAIQAVSFSEDGVRLVSGGNDTTVRVWDVVSGQIVRVLEGNKERVSAVGISGDGNRCASGGADNVLRVWECESGKVIRVLEGHSKPIYSIAISHDGTVVASGGEDCTFRVWDVASGSARHVVLKGHIHHVIGVAISKDGRRTVSRGRDGVIRVWDALSGHEIRQVQGFTKIKGVDGVSMSADGRFVVEANRYKRVRIWEVDSGRVCAEVQVDGGIADAYVSFSGFAIAATDEQGQLKIWEATVGEGVDLATL